jgi:N-methylhydantoinase A
LCYGRGGTEPTVTDAHLLLGRLPAALLGGDMALDADAARGGLRGLADRLDLDVEACAEGVLEIAVWNQANAIRQVTVKRGLDVRDFALAAFGGSGPLQVCRLVDLLGLSTALVPANPGNLSAFGLLTVDVRNDYVQTFVRHHADLDRDDMAEAYHRLTERAAAALRREGFDDDRHRYVRQADLRYAGQAFEVRVDAPDGPLGGDFADRVVAAFHDAHEQTYGYSYRHDASHGVEWVNLRVSGVGPIDRPTLRRLAAGDGDAARARSGTRTVRFDGAWHDTPIYDRAALRAGDELAGPAVIEEFGSTVPLAPGFAARVDELANIVIRTTAA